MATVTPTAHYFVYGWSQEKVKQTRRKFARQFHPDLNPGPEQALATSRMQQVNAEADFAEKYPGSDDARQSNYELTGKHFEEMAPKVGPQSQSSQAGPNPYWQDSRYQGAGRSQSRSRYNQNTDPSEQARRAAEQAEARARQAEEEARRAREAAEAAERVAEARRREDEAKYGKTGEAAKPGTPRWKVKQERMF